jgi:TRAP transporter TAXI family solute receptor
MMRIAMIFHMVLIIGTLNLTVLSSPKAQPEENIVLLSSRGAASLYYPTAGSIAHAVNQKRKAYGFRITVQSRRSSVSVLNKVISGEIYFGEVQQSRIYQAQKGLAAWKGRPQVDLCSVFNTHAEYITLIASVDSGIRTIRDLKDMRVGVGSPGSDLYDNAVDILAAVGINYKSDLSVVDDSLETVPDLLQDGDIDAYFWPVGKLSRPLADSMSGTKKVHLVAIAAPEIDALIAANPFYEKATVPMTLYPGIDDHGGVEALGVKMSIVTSCGMPDQTVHTIAKETFENFGPFEKRHPTASMMTRKAMIEGLQAPVHPGAMKYYKESGMDPMLRA